MFSVDQSLSAAPGGAHPRRRRNRYESDSLQQQAPPRKRTRLTSAQFKQPSPDAPHVNGNGSGNGTIHKPANAALRDSKTRTPTKNDSTIILSKTPKYTLNLLPGLPDKLRKSSNDFRAFFRLNNYSNQAIAVTAEAVLIWDCSHHASSTPVPKSLTLPYPVKSVDFLPLACAVMNPSKDLGLVLVYPDTGKITYWENIDSAESLKLFDKRRQGVEGQLKKYGSENVTQIFETESNGVVLLTDYGRVAHISLQDSYGNPQINASFLPGQGNASFLTSIASSLTGGWNSKINSLRCRQLEKGRVQIIALDEEGIFKVWSIADSGPPTYTGEFDFTSLARESLSEAGVTGEHKFSLKYLDFNQVRSISHEISNDSFALHCILIAQIEIQSKSQILVLEAMITSSRQSIYRIFPVNVFKPQGKEPLRSIFSSHEETITLVQGLSIGILSWPLPKDSVEDGPVQVVHYFEDALKCTQRKTGEILAIASEDRSNSGTHSRRSPTGVLMFTKSSGLVKLSPNPYHSKHHSPSAENKLEQTVFFGRLSENILNLEDLSNFEFTSDDIETAAVKLSESIVNTASDFLPQSASSMEHHLALRMKLLQDLANYLKTHHPDVSRATRWKLLFDAEKLAAARAIWKSYDKKLNEGEAQEVSLLQDTIKAALERTRDNEKSKGEDIDDVRLWFTKHVSNLEKLFPVCFGMIKSKARADKVHTEHILHLAQEMHDLVAQVLGTAFDFRQRHVSLYGLQNEDIEDGVLTAGYEDLPKFWTSDSEMNKAVSWSIDLSKQVVTGILSKVDDPKKIAPGVVDQAVHLASGMDVVVKLSCKSYMEGYRWLMAQENVDDRNKGLDMKTTFETTIRRDQIVGLYDMGQGQRGLALAEELEDVPALVDLSLLELDEQKADAELLKSPATSEGLEKIENQIKHYFRKFGPRFAKPFYQGQVSSHRLGDLLNKEMGPEDQRTDFLRSEPKFAKLSWINDAIHDDSLVHVGDSLMKVAEAGEANFWSKGLELAIAKLALRSVPGSREPSVVQNAGIEDTSTKAFADAVTAHHLLLQNDRQLMVWKIQQKLYKHVRQAIVQSLDEDAALDNVMNYYSKGRGQKHHALTQLLKLGFSDLISHRSMSAESLIDVLTLMDEVALEKVDNDDEGFQPGTETNLALQVLDHADLEPEAHDTLYRLIWKRCLLKDDWNLLSKTNAKSDRNIDERLMNTTTFIVIKTGLSESSKLALTPFNTPTPATLIGAGSSPKDYKHRFPNEELRVPIAKDNALDDKALQAALKHADIQGLMARMKELAEEEVEHEAAEAAEKVSRYAEFVNGLSQNDATQSADGGYVEEELEVDETGEEDEEEGDDTQELEEEEEEEEEEEDVEMDN